MQFEASTRSLFSLSVVKEDMPGGHYSPFFFHIEGADAVSHILSLVAVVAAVKYFKLERDDDGVEGYLRIYRTAAAVAAAVDRC